MTRDHKMKGKKSPWQGMKARCLGFKLYIKEFIAPINAVFRSSFARYCWCGFLLGVALIATLVNIIRFILSPDAERFRELGKTLNVPKAVPIEPLRGSIYSSDDRPIAVTAPVYRLFFDFKHQKLKLLHKTKTELDSLQLIQKKVLWDRLQKDLDNFALILEKSFEQRGIHIDRVAMRERWQRELKRGNRYASVINMNISYLQYKELLKQEPLYPPIIDSIRGKRARISLLRSIMTQPDTQSKRINPFGSLALRTIGSVYGEKDGNLSRARQGLEAGFDSLLRGKEGQGLLVHGALNKNLKTIKAATDGYNVYTTLDMNLQSQLERIMRKQLTNFKAESGTAILLDVATAKVLAITNLLKSKSGGYVEGQNFAITDLSEPGSTFKVASMLVALENHLVQPQDTIDVGNGIWEVARRKVRDHNAHHGGYGRITASQVIERSSNVGIAKVIHKHFKDKPANFVQQVKDLAFGYDLRVEIPGAAQARIRMPNERWYGTTLAWMSFGYETQIPPIYTVAFFNAIANGGKLMKPYLVRKVQDKYGQVIEEYPPRVLREQIASPSSIEAIQDMLRKVVTDGTGKKLNSPIVAISGKSGTAQIAKAGGYRGPEGTSHQVSFCGYFPSEKPKYTLMVVIREPSREFVAGGGSMAGPVVRELAEAITSLEETRGVETLDSINVDLSFKPVIGRKRELSELMQRKYADIYQPGSEIKEDSFVSIDAKGREIELEAYGQGQVPNVLGMTLEDACYLLHKAKYRIDLKGYGRVVEQVPSPKTKLAQSQMVRLVLKP